MKEEIFNACKKGDLNEVKYLVEKGGDIALVLVCASWCGKLDIVKYLVDKGVDIHAHDDEAFVEACCRGHLKVVKYLVEKGANIHAQYDEALSSAAWYKDLNMVKYLIDKGANRCAISANSYRALKYLALLDKIRNRKATIIQRYYKARKMIYSHRN